MKKVALLLVFFLFAGWASATTQIGIYLDEKGGALFLGETTSNISLPSGIVLENNKIRGTTQELTSKQGSIWRFTYSLVGSELNIVLPEGAEIVNVSLGSISLDSSRFSIYAPGSIDVFYTIKSQQSTSLYWVIALLVLILGASVFLFMRKKRSHKNDRLTPVMSLLNEREKSILETLKKTGKVKGSQLRRLSEIPKASFSRHIHELERKKLIRLSGDGKNKFIELV